jgi:O-antigen ligase
MDWIAVPAGRIGANRPWSAEAAGLLLLLGLVVTLPIEASKALFPIQQVEIARIFAALGIAWVAIRMVRGERPIPAVIGVPVGLQVGVVVLSGLLMGPAESLFRVTTVVAYAAMMVFVAEAVTSLRTVGIVAVTVFVTAVAEAGIALAQQAAGFYIWREGVLDVLGRSNATFGDPNILARFLGLGGLAGVALITIRPWHRKSWDIGALLGLAAIGAALVVTQSRTGWLALGIVMAVSLATHFRSVRSLVGAGILATGFVLSLAMNAYAPGRLGELATGIGESIVPGTPAREIGTLPGTSVDAYHPPRTVPGHELLIRLPVDGVRIYLIEAGIAMWQDHVLFGVGTGGFSQAILGDYRAFIPLDRRASPVSLPHTSVIEVVAENGLAGLIALLGLAVGTVLAARRADLGGPAGRVVPGTLLAGIALVFLASQAEGRLFSEPYLWLMLGLLAATVRIGSVKAGPVMGVTSPFAARDDGAPRLAG